MMKRTIWLLALLILLCPCVQAESVTVAWRPNAEADLLGYKLYYGNQHGSYDEVLNVGFPGLNSEGKEEYVVSVAPEGQYYFVVTAYDTAYNESPFSNEAAVDFSSPPDSGRWLVTMNDIENLTGARYDGEPGEFTIWSKGFDVRVEEKAALEFKANLFGKGSCIDESQLLYVGGFALIIDTTVKSFDITGGSLVDFNFTDCYIADEPSDANVKISELTIIYGAQDTTEIVDISSGQIILEWDFIDEFVDGSTIDTNQYEIHTRLSYESVDSIWRTVAIISQPDTSYDISSLRDSLSVGNYGFRIWPHSHVRGEPLLELGASSTSSEHGWLIEITSSPVPLLAPRKHQLFRVIIRE